MKKVRRKLKDLKGFFEIKIMEKDELKLFLERRKRIIDKDLPRYLPKDGECPPKLRESMFYSLMAGGKRLRPIMAMAAAETCGSDYRRALPTACAIELIHTYSLIHDDLPAIDNDDFRRGRPTSHRVFGEAMAILAGDALLTRAFEILSRRGRIDDKTRISVIRELAYAAGCRGMIGGQVVDIESEGKKVDKSTVIYIHKHKTGALITASVRSGAILAGAQGITLGKMTIYGECIGGAFQIVDDLLDEEGDFSQMGKKPGSDKCSGKSTFPSVAGIAAARREAKRLGQEARRALSGLGDRAAVLDGLIDYILIRRF